MTARRFDRVEHTRRCLRGSNDEAMHVASARHAERYTKLWEEGGDSLVDDAVRVKQAVLEYEGSDAFILSVQRQAKAGGGHWLPTSKQTAAVIRHSCMT